MLIKSLLFKKGVRLCSSACVDEERSNYSIKESKLEIRLSACCDTLRSSSFKHVDYMMIGAEAHACHCFAVWLPRLGHGDAGPIICCTVSRASPLLVS